MQALFETRLIGGVRRGRRQRRDSGLSGWICAENAGRARQCSASGPRRLSVH